MNRLTALLVALLVATAAHAQLVLPGGGGGGGGGGSPGGSSGDVQYNNASAFGGTTGVAYAGVGQFTYALGTITTNLKAVSITGTFNASGTTFDAPFFMNITNTASASGSNLVDIQKGGASYFSVGVTNTVVRANNTACNISFLNDASPGGVGTGVCMYGGLGDSSQKLFGFMGLGGMDANIGYIAANGSGFGYSWCNNTSVNEHGCQSGADTRMSRTAAGVIEVNNGTGAGTTNLREFMARSYVVGGSTPTATGSCTITTKLGGNTAGSFVASGACTGGTVILTFGFTATNGWACDMHDLTTPADLMTQTAYSATTATFTGSMVSSDLVTWKCVAF